MNIIESLKAKARVWTREAFGDNRTIRDMIKKKHREMRNHDKNLCALISRRLLSMYLTHKINEIHAKTPMTPREATTMMALRMSSEDPMFAESQGIHTFETWKEFAAYLKSKGYEKIRLIQA